VDEEILRSKLLALPPQDLISYLRAHGWDTIEDAGGRWIALRYQGEGRYKGATIRVPLSKSFTDYGLRLTEVLETVAIVESRDVETVIEDLELLGSDTCRFRWVGEAVPSGEIPLPSAVRLVGGVREMLFAAAYAALHPQTFYPPGRPPMEVSQFLREVRVSAARTGSYVVTVRVAVEPMIPIRISLLEADDEAEMPFNRRVMIHLARGLEALQDMLGRVVATDGMPDPASYVQKGLSANLCEALADVLDEGAMRLEAAISWSPRHRKSAAMPTRLVVERESRDWIRAIGKTLKEYSPTFDYELHGVVVRLDRRPQRRKDWVGNVWILGFVDDRPVQVLVKGVAEQEYDQFVFAHKNKHVVTCRGELVRQGRQYILQNVRDVRIDAPEVSIR